MKTIPRSLLITFICFLALVAFGEFSGAIRSKSGSITVIYILSSFGVFLATYIAWKFFETLADVIISVVLCFTPYVAGAAAEETTMSILLVVPIVGLLVALVTFPLLPHAGAYSRLLKHRHEDRSSPITQNPEE